MALRRNAVTIESAPETSPFRAWTRYRSPDCWIPSKSQYDMRTVRKTLCKAFVVYQHHVLARADSGSARSFMYRRICVT